MKINNILIITSLALFASAIFGLIMGSFALLPTTLTAACIIACLYDFNLQPIHKIKIKFKPKLKFKLKPKLA